MGDMLYIAGWQGHDNGVFLCASRHQIHVRACVIIMEGVSVDAGAYQVTLERIVFTPSRMQLFRDPRC